LSRVDRPGDEQREILVTRIAFDTGIDARNVDALAFEHLSKILRGGKQGAGRLDALIMAARREQNIGDRLDLWIGTELRGAQMARR
jgi:hypothetical protein